MFLFLFSTQRDILVYADPPGRTFFLSVVRRKRKGRANINCDIRTEMKADIYFATAQKTSVLSLPSFLLLPSTKSQISMWSFLLHRKLQLCTAITGNSTFVFHGMGIRPKTGKFMGGKASLSFYPHTKSCNKRTNEKCRYIVFNSTYFFIPGFHEHSCLDLGNSKGNSI